MGHFLIRRFRRAVPLGVLLLVSLTLCSCSKNDKPLYPARGTVTFKDAPAAKAMVVFHPLNDPGAVKPRAIVDQEGNFQAYTYSAGDGIPPGEYVVTVVGHRPKPATPGKKKKHDDGSGRMLPPHYEDPKTSELRITIQEGVNELPPFLLKGK